MPKTTPCHGFGVTHRGARGRAAILAVVVVALLGVLTGAIILIARSSTPGIAKAGQGGAAAGRDGAATIQQALDGAKVYINEGKFSEAGIILDRAIQQFPADQDLRLKYAEVLQWQKRWPEAYEQMAAAVNIGPDLPQIHFDAGTIANKAGLLDRAEQHYGLAQTKDKNDPRYPLYLAMIQIKRGHDIEAMASLLRVVHLKPEIAEAWGTLAELDLRQNNLSLALQHVEKARALQPDSLKWRLVEAKALKRQGDPEKALTLLLALDPLRRSDPAVLSTLAECYGLLKRPDDAAAMYADAAKARPDDAELAYQAALWFQRAGDVPAAKKQAQAAATAGHDKARALLNTLK